VLSTTESPQIEQLEREIDKERATIKTDQVSMSIGELATLYKDKELDINPDFQRVYRWDEDRKSKLIESIFLGIPIPSIFVAQRSDGVWDVVDGLQRLSTIFELLGVLRDYDAPADSSKLADPLVLHRTRYLPALEGVTWNGNRGTPELSGALKLFFKRERLEIKVIRRESNEQAKFELFQRLNTGGAQLSEQEIRNAMLIAANKPFYQWIKRMAESEDFIETTGLSERVIDERFNYELVLRFLVLRRLSNADLSSVRDLGDFLTDQMMDLSKSFADIEAEETDAFVKTFAGIRRTIGESAFRKFVPQKQRFTGGFSISAFEILAIGLSSNLNKAATITKDEIRAALSIIWSDAEFISSSGSGIRASTRIPVTVSLGRKELGK
jgi:hypothetical protein